MYDIAIAILHLKFHLEEVHLVVSSGQDGGVQVTRDSGETFRYLLWVAGLTKGEFHV